jgi:dihydroxy-acid dehydratase
VDGGPIAVVRDGDIVSCDVDARRLDVELTPDEIADRLKGYTPPPPRYQTGALAKYARLVGPASKGAVTS